MLTITLPLRKRRRKDMFVSSRDAVRMLTRSRPKSRCLEPTDNHESRVSISRCLIIRIELRRSYLARFSRPNANRCVAQFARSDTNRSHNFPTRFLCTRAGILLARDSCDGGCVAAASSGRGVIRARFHRCRTTDCLASNHDRKND